MELRKMKLLKEIIAYGALVAGSLGLFGCSDVRKPVAKPVASVSTGYGQPYVAVGDVTGDGRKDIVYGDKKGVFYLESLGDGKFGNPIKAGETGPLGYGQVPVAVGDVTGDGLEDIVIGNKSGISVLENQGAGIFKPLK